MLGASFLPARLRNDHPHVASSAPGYLSRQITPILQSISRKAFTHPIHAIGLIALLASSSYIGLLEGSLFDHASSADNVTAIADFGSLMKSSQTLRVGEETGWEWKLRSNVLNEIDKVRMARLSMISNWG